MHRSWQIRQPAPQSMLRKLRPRACSACFVPVMQKMQISWDFSWACFWIEAGTDDRPLRTFATDTDIKWKRGKPFDFPLFRWGAGSLTIIEVYPTISRSSQTSSIGTNRCSTVSLLLRKVYDRIEINWSRIILVGFLPFSRRGPPQRAFRWGYFPSSNKPLAWITSFNSSIPR